MWAFSYILNVFLNFHLTASLVTHTSFQSSPQANARLEELQSRFQYTLLKITPFTVKKS